MENMIHVAAPVVLLWLLLFVWHLWLAPAALAYETAREAVIAKRSDGNASAVRAPSMPRVKPINWAVWKERQSYNLIELAAILGQIDPSNVNEEKTDKAYLKLLQEDAMNRKLPVKGDRNAESYQMPDLWPSYFTVAKTDAIKWAADKHFDLSHIT